MAAERLSTLMDARLGMAAATREITFLCAALTSSEAVAIRQRG